MHITKSISIITFTLMINFYLLEAIQAIAAPKVKFGGTPITLLGKSLKVGQSFPEVVLTNTSLKMISVSSFKGKVTVLSIVPSIDTPTCEKQTHILSEKNNGLDKKVNLVTISRDLPFAQKRFTKEAKTTNLIYLSDYRDGLFGKATGLLIKENLLLTRAMIVLDKKGDIRYLEIVKEIANLPNMEKAFEFAQKLL